MMKRRQEYRVILYDNQLSQWLEFQDLLGVIAVTKSSDVWYALNVVHDKVIQDHLFAAGFLSYEAAPAFDEALKVRNPGGFPTLSFGLFRDVRYHKHFPLWDPHKYSVGPWAPNLTEEEYASALEDIRTLLGEGETYQVNFSYRRTTKFGGSAEAMLVDMLRGQTSHYGAFIDSGEFIICSGSPELFFRKDGGHLLSRPMKGTRKRGLTLEDDRRQVDWLYHSEKNRAENVMIVDMVRNDMGRIAKSGTVRVPELYAIEKYPTVWQMTSAVACETDAALPEIFQALFPCASITGAPKVRTMVIIADLERSPRNIYTGSIGYIAPDGSAQFNVAIRTALIDKENSTIEYGTGGGIVWDSDPTEEYQESLLKTAQIDNPWPDFQLLETILWDEKHGYFLLKYHLSRLLNSAEYFDYDFNEPAITDKLQRLQMKFTGTAYRVRLLLSEDSDINLDWSLQKPGSVESPVQIRLAPRPVDPENRFLYHKTTHRFMYEFDAGDFHSGEEFVLWNSKEEITETSIANVVIRWRGKLITSPVKCGLLPGTMRQWLIDRGEILEYVITKAMLTDAEEIYLVNSVRKWRRAVLKE